MESARVKFGYYLGINFSFDEVLNQVNVIKEGFLRGPGIRILDGPTNSFEEFPEMGYPWVGDKDLVCWMGVHKDEWTDPYLLLGAPQGCL